MGLSRRCLPQQGPWVRSNSCCCRILEPKASGSERGPVGDLENRDLNNNSAAAADAAAPEGELALWWHGGLPQLSSTHVPAR
jgi:hypothetical protein